MRGKNDMLYIYRERKITPQNGGKSYTLYPSLMREEVSDPKVSFQVSGQGSLYVIQRKKSYQTTLISLTIYPKIHLYLSSNIVIPLTPITL